MYIFQTLHRYKLLLSHFYAVPNNLYIITYYGIPAIYHYKVFIYHHMSFTNICCTLVRSPLYTTIFHLYTHVYKYYSYTSISNYTQFIYMYVFTYHQIPVYTIGYLYTSVICIYQ